MNVSGVQKLSIYKFMCLFGKNNGVHRTNYMEYVRCSIVDIA